jgi:hypothetical protein
MHAPNISRILQILMILFSTQTIQKLEYEQKRGLWSWERWRGVTVKSNAKHGMFFLFFEKSLMDPVFISTLLSCQSYSWVCSILSSFFCGTLHLLFFTFLLHHLGSLWFHILHHLFWFCFKICHVYIFVLICYIFRHAPAAQFARTGCQY